MKAAGLDVEGSTGVVGDAGVTVFTSEIDGQEVINRVGDTAPGRPGASPQRAIDLLNRLLDPSETWGARDGQPSTFTPTAYKVYAAFMTDTPASLAVGWPLATSLDAFGVPAQPDFGVTGLRTGVVSGADAIAVQQAFKDFTGNLALSDNQGKLGTFQVWIRPLLPPELSQ
jgi:hypothetical protein